MFGISLPQLLIILVIVLLLFGTSRLRNLGTDLGGAIRGFRKSMGEEGEGAAEDEKRGPNGEFIEGEVQREGAEAAAERSADKTR